MMTVELFILLIAGYGCGYLLVLFLRAPALESLRFNIGFCFISLFTTVASLLGEISLTTCARTLFLVGLGGLALHFYRSKKKSKKIKSDAAYPRWTQPIVLLPLMLLGLGLVFGWNYSVRHWDEFTHWILMPRQMFYANQLISEKFVVKDFVCYTPGWSIVMIFPQLVLGKDFVESHIFWAPLLSCVGLFALVWDLLRLNASKIFLSVPSAPSIEAQNKKHLILLCWLLTTLTMFFSFGLDFFRPSSLIDPSLKNMTAVLLILMMFYSQLTLRLSSAIFMISIVLAVGYLFKKPFVALMFPTFAFCWLISRSETTRFRRISFFVLTSLASTVLFLLVADIWRESVTPWGEYWNLTKHIDRSSFAQLWQERSIIFVRFFIKLYKLLLREWFTTVAVILAAVHLYKKASSRQWLVIPLMLFASYSAGLLYMYFASYETVEALDLASFNRYMVIVIHPIKLVVILAAVLQTDFVSALARHRYLARVVQWFTGKHAKKKLMAVIVIVFTAWIVEHLLFKLQAQHDPHQAQVEKINHYIQAQNRKDLKLQLISQKDLGLNFQKTQYWSFDNRQVYFELNEGWAFKDGETDFWTKKVTPSEFRAHVQQADLIWVQNGDEWIFEQLKVLTGDQDCPSENGIILVKKGPSEYACETFLIDSAKNH